ERESQLLEILRREVRGITAIFGDATDLENQLRRLAVDRLAAVVSSLPIKWFPLEAQRAVLRPCFARLCRDGLFLHLTNASSSAISSADGSCANRGTGRKPITMSCRSCCARSVMARA